MAIVGEPPGTPSNAYRDAVTRTYARTGLRLDVSTRWWQLSSSDDVREHLAVDVAAPFPGADYFAGKDPAVDAILRGDEMRSIVAITRDAGGAAASEREDGALASYRDVDGDGKIDLLLDIPSSMMHLGARSSRVFLSGRTLDGRWIKGSAPLRTIASVRAERRLAARPDPAAEKRPRVPIASCWATRPR